MITIIFIGLVIGSFYFLTILSFLIGFLKTKTYKKTKPTVGSVFLSVIIPFKNESANLPKSLQNFLNQSLPSENFELIYVDDYSDDDGFLILNSLSENLSHVKLLHNRYSQGKKYALKTGIENAKGNLIVTSDADCTSHPERLRVIRDFYASRKPKMIIAPANFSDNNFFEKMQALDFMSLTSSGYGAAGIGRPIMCNGANLIYEKQLFAEFEPELRFDIPSGDDMFLLHAVKSKYRSEIKFLKSEKASVYCKPESTVKNLIRQRIRWASKSAHYRDIDTIAVALIVALMNIYILFASAALFTKLPFYVYTFFPLMFKLIIDFAFLFVSARYFNKTKLLRLFIPTWFAGLFFYPLTAILSVFKKSDWKN